VAILPFDNLTTEPTLTQEVSDSVRSAVQGRLGLRQAGESSADAIVRGSISRYDPDVPVAFTGGNNSQVTVTRGGADDGLVETSIRKSLWQRAGMTSKALPARVGDRGTAAAVRSASWSPTSWTEPSRNGDAEGQSPWSEHRRLPVSLVLFVAAVITVFLAAVVHTTVAGRDAVSARLAPTLSDGVIRRRLEQRWMSHVPAERRSSDQPHGKPAAIISTIYQKPSRPSLLPPSLHAKRKSHLTRGWPDPRHFAKIHSRTMPPPGAKPSRAWWSSPTVCSTWCTPATWCCWRPRGRRETRWWWG
jgi:hypothetical protein